MAYGKWIGGVLGWMLLGPLGGVVGYFIGSKLDESDGSSRPLFSSTPGDGSPQSQAEGNRNSFLFSLLVLASFVIKADGRIMHSEMEYVRQWLRQNFGEEARTQGDEILRRLFEEAARRGDRAYRDLIRECCAQIANNTDLGERLQLLSFLVSIAQADGSVDGTEVSVLKDVARWMSLSTSEVDVLLDLGNDSLEAAYHVLGVSPDATDEVVRKAYRKLALEHHPDRVAALGEDVRKAAEKKFQEINAAKERIWKARGL